MNTHPYTLDHPLTHWELLGQAFERGPAGTYDSIITGDPCIVWDAEQARWLMYYFAMGDAGKAQSLSIGVAVSRSADEVGSGDWTKLGPVAFTNPESVCGAYPHKPWILLDPYAPNRAALLDGQYLLFFVSRIGLNKVIQRATSSSLYGPWTVQEQPVIAPDSIDGFDSYHCDTVTAYWFESQQKILMFYKGYPQYPQADQPLSPYGSCTCAAWMTPEEQIAHKLGRLMRPVPELSSWAAGWRSTLQIFPCISGGWLGITNSSPRAPGNMYELHNREPGPSLGGWAFSPEPFPTSGWVSDAQPMYWVHALPKPYYEAGIHDNLCRHHILWVDPDHIYLFFNSTGIPNDSPAGNEQLYVFRSQDV